MHIKSPLLLIAALLASVAALPALADDWHGHGGDPHGYFHGYNFDHWRGGNWFHGPHGGRDGWWWIVDGAWYFYPAPVYPYPDPYTPPTVVVEPAPAGTVVQHAYYYCANPAGYYPTVAQCYGAWQRVLSTAQTQVVVTAAPQAVPAPQPAPPPAAMPSSAAEQRKADEHRLHEYEADLRNIDLTGQQAGGRLSELARKVEEFQQGLYNRSYNAMSLSKDAEKLQRRIGEDQAKLGSPMPPGEEPPPPNAAPSGAVSSPPAGSIPPGSTITFPSH